MSNDTYNAQWEASINDVYEQALLEDPTLLDDPTKPPAQPAGTAPVSIATAFNHFARLYIKYMQTYKKLESCYHNMVHPQKRADVLAVLEQVMRRVIELRHLIVKWNPRPDIQPTSGLEFPVPWEYVCLDDILVDLKLPPEALEVPVPHYFKEDNAAAIKLRDRMLEGYNKLKHGEERIPIEEEPELDPTPEELTLEQTLEIIQRNERGRQGKFRAKVLKDERDYKLRVESKSAVEVPEDVAASDIQRCFRGYQARVLADQMREEELIFLGMKPAPGTATKDEALAAELGAAAAKRKTEQVENAAAYSKALVDLKAEVLRDEGPLMRDRLRQERHLWVTDKIADSKEVPEDLTEFYKDRYPALPEPEEEDAGGGAKKKGKDDKKGKKDDKKDKGKKKKASKDDEPPPVPPPLQAKSEVTTALYEGAGDYRGGWQGKDESYNFAQKHDVEVAKRAIRVDVERELRDTVDEMLKQNLAKIKAQLEAGGKGGKKKKGKGGKKKKGKGGKGGKKKKGKGKGKPLPGEKIGEIKSWSVDEMLADLIENKLVNQYKPRKVSDLLGGFTYNGNGVTAAPEPSMAQLRGLLTEYAVLPLGSRALKASLSDDVNIKSIMMYGPAGSGKTMMVEAIASELGAMVVNISPHRLAGLYTGKTGPTKLMHLIYKVAAENVETMPKGNPQAPVIVYMDECDKFFEAGGKKVKVDKSGPSRFKKDLLAYRKNGFKTPDRVLFIGTTKEPHKANKKDLWDFFDKFLYMPYPDYPTRKLLYKSFVTKIFKDSPGMLEVPSNVEEAFSTLARISNGFSAGAVERVVKKTLTPARTLRLAARPLEPGEFLNNLALEAVTNQARHEEESVIYGDFTEMITKLADHRQKVAKINNPDAGGDEKKKKKN